jgi:hypothetical protein
MRRQPGFFDVDDRLKRLSDRGDQLEAFEAAVEFEAFRLQLNSSRVCQAFGFCRMMVSLPRGSEITVTQAMTFVCCIAVSAETRTPTKAMRMTPLQASTRLPSACRVLESHPHESGRGAVSNDRP